MQSEAMSPELAKLEVDKWLDFKKVAAKKRETYKDAVEALTDALVNGTISIGEEDMVITHKLIFPVKDTAGQVAFDSLQYKPRITVEAITLRTKNIKPGDSDARIMAYVAALTDKAAGLLNKMDTEDNSIAQSVAVFFL